MNAEKASFPRLGGTFPRLETARLVLREITADDTPAIYHLFADDEVTRYLDIESFTSIDQAQELITWMARHFAAGTGIRWGIVLKENHALIGTCGYNNWIKVRASRGEVGYDLAQPYWMRGYVSEALDAVLRYGFEHMALNRVEAMVTLGNGRSISVLRKLGFQREGILREYSCWKGQHWDQLCYSLLKREWARTDG